MFSLWQNIRRHAKKQESMTHHNEKKKKTGNRIACERGQMLGITREYLEVVIISISEYSGKSLLK